MINYSTRLASMSVIVFLLTTSYCWATDYYEIGNDAILNVARDSNPGQLLITSGDLIYIVLANDGSILEEFQLPTGVWIAEPGIPDVDFIYGIGGNEDDEIHFKLDRNSGEVAMTIFPEDYILAGSMFQSDTHSYILSKGNESHISYYDRGMMFVYSKSDLTVSEQWRTKEYAEICYFDKNNNIAYIPPEWGYFDDTDDDGQLSSPNDECLSDIGVFDITRSGGLMYDYWVLGTVGGLAMMSDGTLVAGIDTCAEWIEEPTFVILSDPTEEVHIPDVHIITLDFDPETNRIFGLIRPDSYEWTPEYGDVIVWDYDTREYTTIEVDVEYLKQITFLDGVLYGITREDNRLYYIPID